MLFLEWHLDHGVVGVIKMVLVLHMLHHSLLTPGIVSFVPDVLDGHLLGSLPNLDFVVLFVYLVV